ncbi:MAG: aminotransferase class V-fold PLP-dependent enzyme [Bacillota bacterium]|nr:aminotransferase class V-fold PLP-dependent enzyme [Bacillota bacterium]
MIYLDNAATSYPKPNEVYNEVLRCMKNYAANPGHGSHSMSIRASEKVAETRGEIAQLFNISNPFTIIFTCNTTEGLNIGIKGLLSKGDHVISTITEHNSVLRPLNFMTKKGIDMTLLGVGKNGLISLRDLRKEIKKNTKLIIINHASNVTGSVQNIKAIGQIAKEYNVLFMVDAAQSAGVIPIDVENYNIDILAFPGHKGLLGPQGTGGLYIREGLRVGFYRDGATGSNSNSIDQPDFLPDKFESGTLNTPGIAGLCEGIKYIKRVGIENIQRHEAELCSYLLSELRKIEHIKIYGNMFMKNRCAVVSFNIEGIDSSNVGYLLNNRQIAVRTGYHCSPLIHGVMGTYGTGTVRVSPGYFNTFKDVEKLLDIIKKIILGKIT